MMFGERLRVARARKRMTMRHLGSLIGVTAQAVNKYENDSAMPSSKVLLAICKHLDVSPEWLMCRDALDFHSTEQAPHGRHAKYWVREAIAELKEEGFLT